MLRRNFLTSFLKISGLFALVRPAIAAAPGRAILLQTSPIAGFQYHAGESVWPQLRRGQALDLIREPRNRYDGKAVRIEWHGHILGYVPCVQNTAVAQMLDRGERLTAWIADLHLSSDPWERIELAISIGLL